jgi:hypothetical protein
MVSLKIKGEKLVINVTIKAQGKCWNFFISLGITGEKLPINVFFGNKKTPPNRKPFPNFNLTHSQSAIHSQSTIVE